MHSLLSWDEDSLLHLCNSNVGNCSVVLVTNVCLLFIQSLNIVQVATIFCSSIQDCGIPLA
jgi:hypothetical protein